MVVRMGPLITGYQFALFVIISVVPVKLQKRIVKVVPVLREPLTPLVVAK